MPATDVQFHGEFFFLLYGQLHSMKIQLLRLIRFEIMKKNL